MKSQVQLKWSDLQQGEKKNVLGNRDQQPRLAYLEENVKKVNKIKFSFPNNTICMIGLCDKSIRQERGMIFQDKSNIGHGTYLLYSSYSGSFLFSHWDLESNYNEGGFVLSHNDEIEVIYEIEQKILKIVDIKNLQRSVMLQTKNHNLEDLHLCVVIIYGEILFYR